MSEGPRMHPLGVRREGVPLARSGVAAVHISDTFGVQRWGNSPWNWEQQQRRDMGVGYQLHHSQLIPH